MITGSFQELGVCFVEYMRVDIPHTCAASHIVDSLSVCFATTTTTTTTMASETNVDYRLIAEWGLGGGNCEGSSHAKCTLSYSKSQMLRICIVGLQNFESLFDPKPVDNGNATNYEPRAEDRGGQRGSPLILLQSLRSGILPDQRGLSSFVKV